MNPPAYAGGTDLMTAKGSCRQRPALCFFAEWQEQKAHEKGQRREGHGSPDGVIVGDAGADEEGDAGACKSSH